MKRILLSIVAAAAMSSAAMAAPSGSIVTKDSYGFNTFSGGEYRVVDFSGGFVPQAPQVVDSRPYVLPSIFQTFSVERVELMYIGQTYGWEMNTGSIQGSIANSVDASPAVDLSSTGGQGMGDPLDARTAYLFTQFSRGVLSNYDYLSNTGANLTREGDAYDLQMAIWYIEEEPSTIVGRKGTKMQWDELSSQAQAWVTEAGDAVANNQWSGLQNVRVLNLTDANGGNAQDLLVMVPLPASAWSGLGLLVGMAGLRAVRSRRS